MHAYLIAGRESGKVEEEANNLIERLKAKRLDFEVTKIADVRELGRFARLALAEKTAIVITNFDQATEPAQNAFLKNLEEPLENLVYILTSRSKETVLPTISSRCQVIEISSFQSSVSKEIIKVTKKFINSSVGEKLAITSKIKSREEATEFLNNLITAAHRLMLNDPNLAFFLEEASKTINKIAAYGNVQLQLTNFVVNLGS